MFWSKKNLKKDNQRHNLKFPLSFAFSSKLNSLITYQVDKNLAPSGPPEAQRSHHVRKHRGYLRGVATAQVAGLK